MEESSINKDNGDLDLQSLFSDKNTLAVLSVSVLVVFLLLVGGLYYWVSKKSKGQIVFPAGVNYTSPESKNPTPTIPKYDYAAMTTSADWLTFKGKTYPYLFQHPKDLVPVPYPGDPNDSVTFRVSPVPPEINLMLLVETISTRDKGLVGKPEEFIRSYPKFFPGLATVKNFTPFENEKGLKGFKVNFVTKANLVGTDNYFLVVPGDADHMLHVNNIFPKEGDAVFMRLLNSLEYGK